MGRITKKLDTTTLHKMAAAEGPEFLAKFVKAEGSTVAQINSFMQDYADNLRNTGDAITDEEVEVSFIDHPGSSGELEVVAKFYGSAKDNRPAFNDWLQDILCATVEPNKPFFGKRGHNPSAKGKARKFPHADINEYGGRVTIYPPDIPKVYPELASSFRSLSRSQKGDVIDEFWSYVDATITESPELQKHGFSVGHQPDGDNFTVYWEKLPSGRSIEQILESDAAFAVNEVASGDFAARRDNPALGGGAMLALAFAGSLVGTAVSMLALGKKPPQNP